MSSLSALTKPSPSFPSAPHQRKDFQPSPGQPRYNARDIAVEAEQKGLEWGWQRVRMLGTDGRKYKIGLIPTTNAGGNVFVWMLDGVEPKVTASASAQRCLQEGKIRGTEASTDDSVGEKA